MIFRNGPCVVPIWSGPPLWTRAFRTVYGWTLGTAKSDPSQFTREPQQRPELALLCPFSLSCWWVRISWRRVVETKLLIRKRPR
jgi:hypothetical protein